ncbi:hypothetical protein E3N88_11069 [Mikania micrantha]|uniref:Uncharacterized protein n=1 Tax=Mikania micrantha TaxID=192012 RepID=A0A5N6PDG4_9ASTR|nr:hypothetical protein E3N88_11069 [Mikania micrantha]
MGRGELGLLIGTAYHPQIDGQSERTIQTLKDMLQACNAYANKYRRTSEFQVGDFVLLKVSPWKADNYIDRKVNQLRNKSLNQVKVQWNNIRGFDAMWGRRRYAKEILRGQDRYALGDQIGHVVKQNQTLCKGELGLLIGTAYHPQIDGQSERTIQTLKDMLQACNAYANKYRRTSEFQVGDFVLLKVSPWKADNYIDRKVNQLRNKSLNQVKVQWNNIRGFDAMWGSEDEMKNSILFF